MPALLELARDERFPDILLAARRQILRGLGQNPLPLLRTLRDGPRPEALVPFLTQLLTSQGWDAACAFTLLEGLAAPPFNLRDQNPEAFFDVSLHLMRRCAVSLQEISPFLDENALRRRFLARLGSSLREFPGQHPPLTLDFLTSILKSNADAETKKLCYDLLELETDARAKATESLTTALLGEADPELAAHASACLRRRIFRHL